MPRPAAQHDHSLVVAFTRMAWRRHGRRWRCRLRSRTPGCFGPHDAVLSEDEPSTAQPGNIDGQTLQHPADRPQECLAASCALFRSKPYDTLRLAKHCGRSAVFRAPRLGPPHLFIRKAWEDRSEGLARRHALLIPCLRSFKIFLARCTEPTPKPRDRHCESVARISPAGTGPSP